MGCIGQVGPDAFNARRVALAAGVPVSVPAYTVNRLCGSGLQAVWSAAMQMRWGGVELALAGGNENMSRMPFYDFGARAVTARVARAVDGTVAMLTDPFHGVHMGITAENVARTRRLARAAGVRGRRSVARPPPRRAGRVRAGDHPGRGPAPHHRRHRRAPPRDHPRHPGRARPAFDKDGTVTAGNASGINDGAAAVVLARIGGPRAGPDCAGGARGRRHRGVEPELMGYAPVLALANCSSRPPPPPPTSTPSSSTRPSPPRRSR